MEILRDNRDKEGRGATNAVQDVLILAVEDHALHGRLLRAALRRRLPGCRVELLDDGRTARSRLLDPAAETPGLVILDLDLPGRSGHELLADRAGIARLAAVPTAVVSASAKPAVLERSLALGADLHLPKPVSADGFAELAERLAALLHGSQPTSRDDSTADSAASSSLDGRGR